MIRCNCQTKKIMTWFLRPALLRQRTLVVTRGGLLIHRNQRKNFRGEIQIAKHKKSRPCKIRLCSRTHAGSIGNLLHISDLPISGEGCLNCLLSTNVMSRSNMEFMNCGLILLLSVKFRYVFSSKKFQMIKRLIFWV